MTMAACAEPGVPAGGFTADAAGERWAYRGTLTFDNAANVFEAARALPLPSRGDVDLAELSHADSAALAVLLALKRRGIGEQHPVTFTQMPASLASLAHVYGIGELLVAGA